MPGLQDKVIIVTGAGGDAIVATALGEFGAVHGVVNNAGILRDRAFHKMTDEDWQAVLEVHLLGSYRVTRAAWPHFREQQYGRVLMTTSPTACTVTSARLTTARPRRPWSAWRAPWPSKAPGSESR